MFDLLTEDSAYWIGFLLTDGNITHNRNSTVVQLCLSVKDYKHIEKFKQFLKSKHTICKSKGKAIIRFASKRIADQLSLFGVVPRKTGIEEVRHLENNRHFWRGVVDGDGCISFDRATYHNSWKLILCGSEQLMQQFLDFVRTVCPTCGVTVRKVTGKSLHYVSLSTKTATKVIGTLYRDSHIYLDRKYVRAMEAVG